MKRLLPDRTIVSLLGLIAVLLVCVAYLLTAVLNLPLTGRPAQVTVELPRTGGLFEGSAASYRGTRVGTVDKIRVNPDGGVVATISLADGVEIPKSTAANVRSLSPVGEQYLDFRPDSDTGPYLENGDTIEADAVDIPVSFAEAAESLSAFIDVIDADQLHTLLVELGAATDGVGDDLEALLNATDELSTTLDTVWPETQDLLQNGQAVGELFASNVDNLERFAASARSLAAFLRDFDPTFQDILERTGDNFANAELLVSDLRPVLPPLLGQLEIVGEIVYQHEPHVRALPDSLYYGMSRFATTFQGGWLQVDLWLQGAAECDYRDYRGDPMDGIEDRQDLYLDGRCAVGAPVTRGAASAPGAVDR